MEDKILSWLKAMQNGALGEARAKAFLMYKVMVIDQLVVYPDVPCYY
jgi:hypothetical protein